MDTQHMKIVHRRQLGIFSDLFPPHGTSKTSDAGSSTTGSSTSLSTSATTTSTSTSTSTSESSTSTTMSTSETTTSPILTPNPSSPAPVMAPSTGTINGTQTQTPSISSSATPSATAVAATDQTFLQNKVLSGIVFGIVGIAGLVLITIVATFFIRRRRRNRDINEALSFDPVKMGSDGPNMMEAGQNPTNSKDRSSTSTGYASNGNTPLVSYAGPFSNYALPSMSYTTTSNRPQQRLSQQVNSQQRPYPTGAQQYAQSYDWVAAPFQHSKAASEDEKSRRSGSSSGEFQFAVVTAPVNVSSVHR